MKKSPIPQYRKPPCPPRYSCVFLPRILAFFPVLWGFYSQVYDDFLTNAHIYARKKANIYAFYKQACVCRVTESRSIRGTELDRQQKTPSCMKELKSNFSLNQAWPLSSKVWFLFMALTAVVVVRSPTTDLLESVDCLLRDRVRYFTNADLNNDRFS